jgi:hypothetical protein
LSAARLLLAVAAILLFSGVAAPGAGSKKKERDPAAIIAGTVFQSSGHSLPGAKVEAVAQDDAKIKGNTTTDAQGDFAIRLPAGNRSYVVTATAKGFQPAQKTVEVFENERVRTNLMLSPEPKK